MTMAHSDTNCSRFSHRFAFDATSKQLIEGLAPSRYVNNLLLSLQDKQEGSMALVLG